MLVQVACSDHQWFRRYELVNAAISGSAEGSSEPQVSLSSYSSTPILSVAHQEQLEHQNFPLQPTAAYDAGKSHPRQPLKYLILFLDVLYII